MTRKSIPMAPWTRTEADPAEVLDLVVPPSEVATRLQIRRFEAGQAHAPSSGEVYYGRDLEGRDVWISAMLVSAASAPDVISLAAERSARRADSQA